MADSTDGHSSLYPLLSYYAAGPSTARRRVKGVNMRIKLFLSGIIFVFALGGVSAGAPQGPISSQQLLAWVVGGMSTFHVSLWASHASLIF
jgi:hypothetical protein